MYAVFSFAIRLILLLDTSSCKSSDPLRWNCYRLLLSFCSSSVGVLTEGKLLIEIFFFWRAFLDLCLKKLFLVLAKNMKLSYSWAVEECAFWVKTREDASPLPDVFLGALSCSRSTGVAKCVSIALSDVKKDDIIVCVLLYFRPTGSSGCLRLS